MEVQRNTDIQQKINTGSKARGKINKKKYGQIKREVRRWIIKKYSYTNAVKKIE